VGSAATLYEVLKSEIEREFEELDDEWLNVVYGHSESSVYVDTIGYRDPDVLVLRGVDDEGSTCTVVANATGFSLLIIPVELLDRTPQPVRFIGTELD
jgi:hypothetical protein